METLETMIAENAKLIYKMAHMYKSSGIELDDLIQVGKIGFIEAYNRFDPTYNVKFTTYAYPYINGEISKYVRENKGIKISRNITKLYYQIEKMSLLMSQELMREPTISELSKKLDIEEYIVADALLSKTPIYSLDEPILGEENEMSVYETIASPEVDLEQKFLLNEAMQYLSDEEYQLIQDRYMKEKSQTEVASIFGTSQVQISRKEKKVLQKLKTHMTC